MTKTEEEWSLSLLEEKARIWAGKNVEEIDDLEIRTKEIDELLYEWIKAKNKQIECLEKNITAQDQKIQDIRGFNSNTKFEITKATRRNNVFSEVKQKVFKQVQVKRNQKKLNVNVPKVDKLRKESDRLSFELLKGKKKLITLKAKENEQKKQKLLLKTENKQFLEISDLKLQIKQNSKAIVSLQSKIKETKLLFTNLKEISFKEKRQVTSKVIKSHLNSKKLKFNDKRKDEIYQNLKEKEKLFIKTEKQLNTLKKLNEKNIRDYQSKKIELKNDISAKQELLAQLEKRKKFVKNNEVDNEIKNEMSFLSTAGKDVADLLSTHQVNLQRKENDKKESLQYKKKIKLEQKLEGLERSRMEFAEEEASLDIFEWVHILLAKTIKSFYINLELEDAQKAPLIFAKELEKSLDKSKIKQLKVADYRTILLTIESYIPDKLNNFNQAGTVKSKFLQQLN